MPTWNVASRTSSVSVDTGGWLDALAAALPQFNLPAGTLERFVCAMNPDGSVEVYEPDANVRFRITPDVPPPQIPEMPRSSQVLGEPDDELETIPSLPDPRIDRMVVVFERCAQISAAADEREACTIALTIVRELVASNAGAVLLSMRSGGGLRFVTAFGPRAKKVLNSSLPVNDGIAGFIHGFRLGVIIKDVRRDARFEAGVDRHSGYVTRSLLAVPIHAVSGPVYGCLELLNSPIHFTPEDLAIVQMVASALGAWLRATEDMSVQGSGQASASASG